tara:strand:- start:2 stop:157 length:156 start_codon:yes stop_codon:yes gene_type:complete
MLDLIDEIGQKSGGWGTVDRCVIEGKRQVNNGFEPDLSVSLNGSAGDTTDA